MSGVFELSPIGRINIVEHMQRGHNVQRTDEGGTQRTLDSRLRFRGCHDTYFSSGKSINQQDCFDGIEKRRKRQTWRHQSQAFWVLRFLKVIGGVKVGDVCVVELDIVVDERMGSAVKMRAAYNLYVRTPEGSTTSALIGRCNVSM